MAVRYVVFLVWLLSKLLFINYDTMFEFCHSQSYMLPRPSGFNDLLVVLKYRFESICALLKYFLNFSNVLSCTYTQVLCDYL